MQNYTNNPGEQVQRHSQEAYDPKYVNPKAHVKPDISIIVQAGIQIDSKTKLIIITRDESATTRGFNTVSYIQALEKGLLPVYNGTHHFQHDNTPIHGAQRVQLQYSLNAISCITQPQYSPDLNPIEHIQSILKLRLVKLFPRLFTLRKNQADIAVFKECLYTAQEAVSQDDIRRVISSLPRRLRAVQDANGFYTKY